MRLLLPLLASALILPAAHSQALSLYATYSPTHISGLQNGNAIGGGNTTTSPWTQNLAGGATVNILPVGPIRLGFDLRASGTPHSASSSSSSILVLAGPRLALKLPVIPLKPYIQASGGYLRTQTPLISSSLAGSTYTNSFGAYEILGGVDYPVLPILDLRLIELGGGKAYAITAAGASSNYSASLFTLSSGVVLHF